MTRRVACSSKASCVSRSGRRSGSCASAPGPFGWRRGKRILSSSPGSDCSRRKPISARAIRCGRSSVAIGCASRRFRKTRTRFGASSGGSKGTGCVLPVARMRRCSACAEACALASERLVATGGGALAHDLDPAALGAPRARERRSRGRPLEGHRGRRDPPRQRSARGRQAELLERPDRSGGR